MNAPRTEAGGPAARWQWLAPVAFAGGFLLLGLLTLDAYGPTWDEPLHRSWGEANWLYLRTGDSSHIENLRGAGRHYGPFFYLLAYGLSTFFHEVIGLDFTAANHVPNLIAASLGVACTFLLAERILNRRVAYAATTLLVLLPPFRAHAHYNPKDIPLLTLVTAALLFATIAWRSRRVPHALLAGAFLGLAVAMKPTAVVIAPVLAGALALDIFPSRRDRLRDAIRLAVVAAIASAGALFASWPFLWRQPLRLLESVAYFARGSFWEGNVLYLGEMMPASELPWHYTPVMLLLAMPLVMALLAATGSIRLVRRAREPRARFPAALLLLWAALPLLLFLKPGLARYDGMRQLFFMIPALAILAGEGWDSVWCRSSDRRYRRFIVGLSGVFMAWLAVEGVVAFPYGGSWVNPPARVLLGPRLERSIEVEYWGAPYREGLRWMRDNAPPDAVVCTPVAGHLIEWQPELVRADVEADCTGQPHYVMLITRFAEWPDEYLALRDTEPVFTVSRFGSDLLAAYRVR